MVLRFQVLPLAEHPFVGFHLGHCLCPFEAILAIIADKIVEDKCVGALRAILWEYTDEQQIHRVGLVPFHHT